MVLTAQREHPVVLKMINTAIPHIFDNPNTVFVTAPAKNLLFEGVLFNCTSSDFSTKAICSELKKRAHNFHRISEDIYSFSIFGSVRINKIVLHEFPLSITKDRSLRKTWFGRDYVAEWMNEWSSPKILVARVTNWPLNIIVVEYGMFTTGDTNSGCAKLNYDGNPQWLIFTLVVTFFIVLFQYCTANNWNRRNEDNYNVICSRRKRHRDENWT